MRECLAIDHALEIFRLPSRVSAVRAEPLASAVEDLLIAATDDKALQALLPLTTAQSLEDLREAIAFYIEQILLFPEADAYRTLGAEPDASREQLRGNMAHLLHWLHPDRNLDDERSVYTVRVLAAWDQLKTAERRIQYDSLHRPASLSLTKPACEKAKDYVSTSPEVSRTTLPIVEPAAFPHQGLRPTQMYRGRRIAVWTRRLFLLAFAAIIGLFLLSPNEGLALIERYWNMLVGEARNWRL